MPSRFRFSTTRLRRRSWHPIWCARRRRLCLRSTLRAFRCAKTRTIDFLVAINQRVAGDVRYLIRMEPGVQTPEQTLRALRRLLPRFGLVAGAVAASPGTGGALRVRLSDPAHRRRQGARRPVGTCRRTSPICTPGARSICPAQAGSDWIRPRGCSRVRGTFRLPARPSRPRRRRSAVQWTKVEVQFEHHMSVARVWEAPRVTKPYTEAQWDAIEGMGAAIDDELEQGDVRLTMGGEPTFVSIDDPDGAEWNTDGAGTQQARARRAALSPAARSLRAPGLGALRAGQVVPGRAAAALVAELLSGVAIGEPIWRDRELIADESRDYGVTPALAQKFTARRGRTSWAWIRAMCLPASRMCSTTCGVSGGCRSMSIRSTRGSTIRWSAHA